MDKAVVLWGYSRGGKVTRLCVGEFIYILRTIDQLQVTTNNSWNKKAWIANYLYLVDINGLSIKLSMPSSNKRVCIIFYTYTW